MNFTKAFMPLAPGRRAAGAAHSSHCNPLHFWLVLSLSLLLVAPCLAQPSQIVTGTPIYFSTLTLHLDGQPLKVYEFIVSIHPMNMPPPWPIGLWLYNYVQADPSGDPNDKSTWGQSTWCRWWMNEVATLEGSIAPPHLPYPFFEMNLPTGILPIETDERISVYPAGSVTCWQADNDYAP